MEELFSEVLSSNHALIAAGIGLMLILVRALGTQVNNNLHLSTAMIAQSETMIKLNNELQEQSKERQTWQVERVKLEAEIKEIKTGRTLDMERMERQFNGLLAQIAQVRTQRDRLQGELEAIARKVGDLEKENKDLLQKITALEGENKDLRGERAVLIEKIDNLTRRLEAEIDNNTDLRCELDKLQTRMKDISTDDVTAAAAQVAAANAAKLASSEHDTIVFKKDTEDAADEAA